MTKQRARATATSASTSTDTERPKIPMTTEEQVSAGGVAFRRVGAQVEVAIVSVQPSRRWQLPKGLVDAGETPERAALREVREEAGLDTELISKIETVEYWYIGHARRQPDSRVRYHKFVHFFLMRHVGGDVANHDHEVAEARWVSVDEAHQLLAFKSEKAVVQQAGALIADLAGS